MISPSEIHLQARYDPALASVARTSYQRHEQSIVRARAPPSTVFASGERFAGTSVTKADYSGHYGTRPAPLLRPEERSSVGGDEGRDFQSENAANYKSHGQSDKRTAQRSQR